MHLTPAGGPHERHVRSFAIGWQASKQCWGVTAGKPRHNSSNVRGVTAGKMGRNSSKTNVVNILLCTSWVCVQGIFFTIFSVLIFMVITLAPGEECEDNGFGSVCIFVCPGA